jgi:hypothetical protein
MTNNAEPRDTPPSSGDNVDVNLKELARAFPAFDRHVFRGG